jgi:hypothetical protein
MGCVMATDSIRPLTDSRLPVNVDEVLDGRTGSPWLFAGHSSDGGRWLVAFDNEGDHAPRWLCAPASDVAIGCVRSGRAQPADLFRHSRTGTVEIITIGIDGRMVESIRLCAELGDDELPATPGLLAGSCCA